MGTAANVLVGAAQIYTAPASTAPPTVAPTTGLIVPTTPWVEVGFTIAGLTWSVQQKPVDIMVEEQSTPVMVVPDTADVTLAFEMAEDTLASIALAYGGGTTAVTAPGASSAGYTTLTLSSSLAVVAACFVGVNPAGFNRLVYVPLVVSTAKVDTKYLRAKAPRSYPATLTAICPLNAIVITDVTAVET